MAKIIDGNAMAAAIKTEIKTEIESGNLQVGLAVILVGNDPPSQIYVKYKQKDCGECGIHFYGYTLPEDTKTEELLELIDTLNADPKVNGILVQQPLPAQIDLTAANERISSLKDVDSFRADNVGRVMLGSYALPAGTPAGVMEMLKRENIEIAGKECVVVGRSNIVGKPMAMLLLHENGTVTICHSKTADLKAVCKRADILVAAMRQPNFITADYVKKGAIVIDVGINDAGQGVKGRKLVGDVDFESVLPVAGYITPVPGGVGPMTRAMLMKNTLTAKKLQS